MRLILVIPNFTLDCGIQYICKSILRMQFDENNMKSMEFLVTTKWGWEVKIKLIHEDGLLRCVKDPYRISGQCSQYHLKKADH